MKEQNCMNHSEEVQHLKNIVQCFDDCNISYSLDAGSLLRAYRGNDILLDDDLDIGVFGYIASDLVDFVSKIRNLGYKVRCQGNLPFFEDLIQIKLPNKINDLLYIDVYIYHLCKNEYIRRCIHKPFPGSILSENVFLIISKLIRKEKNSTSIFGRFVYILPYIIRKFLGRVLLLFYEKYCLTVWNAIPVEYILKANKQSINGINFSIMTNPEKYLEHRYGKSWKIPDPNWNYNDCNVYRIRNPNRCLVEKKWADYDLFHIEKHRNSSSKIFDFSKKQVSRILSLDSQVK